MPSWTSALLKASKTAVLGLMILVCLWVLYNMAQRAMKPKAVALEPAFVDTDVVSFVPKLGSVIDVDSDKTVDAILSGAFGPAVVVFRAEWCQHCRNMDDALVLAATSSPVPVVRVTGPATPVCGRKYNIMGYPTIMGVASVGGTRRFSGARTAQALGDFAVGLAGSAQPPQPVPTVPVVSAPVVSAPVVSAPVVSAHVVPMAPMVEHIVDVVHEVLEAEA